MIFEHLFCDNFLIHTHIIFLLYLYCFYFCTNTDFFFVNYDCHKSCQPNGYSNNTHLKEFIDRYFSSLYIRSFPLNELEGTIFYGPHHLQLWFVESFTPFFIPRVIGFQSKYTLHFHFGVPLFIF